MVKKEDKISGNFFVTESYRRQLFDLGRGGNDKLSGILSPNYSEARVKEYLHSQFLESAKTYIDRYQDVGYFTNLISAAFKKINVDIQSRMTMLDLGSGAGNTIFPLLGLCPESFIIASDLSIEMLVFLKQGLKKLITGGTANNCILLQLNAEEPDFKDDIFDIVIGSSVLHHMISPEKILSECARILKKDGHAIFFEPFEEGNMIVRNAYNVILNDFRQNTLSEDVKALFQALITDYDVRIIRNKSLSMLRSLDDKWLFNRKYLFDMAKNYNYSDCIIYPLHDTENQFSNQTISNLRLGKGLGQDALPDWAWKIIQEYDKTFSEETKKELIIEGCLILKK